MWDPGGRRGGASSLMLYSLGWCPRSWRTASIECLRRFFQDVKLRSDVWGHHHQLLLLVSCGWWVFEAELWPEIWKKVVYIFSAKICIFNFSFGAIKNDFSAIFEIEGINILSYYLKLPKMCFCNFKNVQKCVFVLNFFVI